MSCFAELPTNSCSQFGSWLTIKLATMSACPPPGQLMGGFGDGTVTLDISMPELDGLEAIRQIHRRSPEIKIRKSSNAIPN